MMTDQDQAELNAWRLAFDHIADGTPDGAAQAINEQITKLQVERDNWKQVASDGLRIATTGSVYEIENYDDKPQ